MTLATGSRLGAYEILAPLGAGGMGEVYRARDTKLGRDVAIKVLPEAFAHDPDRLSRFQREAKMLAALNHSNIATIYGLEQSNGTSYLVMELVSGETLQQRVAREGRLPVEDALVICRQIAEALEAAHEKGIIHRDLKPANVKVTLGGKVKVLDFGLAKAFAGDGTSEDPSNSPTLSRAATMQGVILGTAAYMSPEQARGKAVDKRTDIWAFGCVLYELLTGKLAFQGETVTEILAAVLKEEPDWQALPVVTPQNIRVLLRRSVRKDVNKRCRDVGDMRIEIEDALTAPLGPELTITTVPHRIIRRWAMASGLVCLVVAAITGLAVWNLKPPTRTDSQAVTRFTIALPPGEELVVASSPAIALSPTGTQLVYVAARGGIRQLYVRSMAGFESRPISGTEGASAPFFSPDGQWVGFFAEGKLKKVPITGGFSQILCEASSPFGGSWGPNDTIFFAPAGLSGLWQVSGKGGTPQPFTKLDRGKGEISHRWPQVLPGGQAVLFAVWTGPGWDESQIEVQAVGGGERRVLIQGDYGSYLPTGHLVYSRHGTGTLLAVPFNLARLEVTDSPPIAVAERVLEGANGATQYTLSEHGLLAYVPGSPGQIERSLVWVDRNGKVDVLAAPARPYQVPRLSPDGQRVAVGVQGPKDELWLYNLARGTFTPLASEGSSQVPAWTPDGKRVAYRATRAGFRNLFWRMADGSGTEERLTAGEGVQTPGSWSSDGQALVFTDQSPTVPDIWVFRPGDREQQPFLRNSSNKRAPMWSPDGHWLVYQSDEAGRDEIYVQPYPGPGGAVAVSTDGGTEPVWSHNGREIFYRSGDKMMSVSVTTQPSFSASKLRILFVFDHRQTAPFAGTPDYDVSLDDQRFLMLKPSEPAQAATQINVVLNWSEELKQKVPATLTK
jgi:serine/threonine protein kinase/Tol biopolymer transport system component